MRKIFLMSILILTVLSSVSYAETKEGARKVIDQWLTLAKQGKWDQMVNLTQLTWRKDQTQDQMAERIKAMYDFYEINSWKYLGKNDEAEALVTFRFEVETKAMGKQFMEANVIVESAPYKPDIVNGQWGVNPTTAMLHDSLSSGN